jgi:YidC/Oxa1 family membrane protein insertase
MLLLGVMGVLVFLLMKKYTGGEHDTARQPLGGESHLVAPARAPEQLCDIWQPLFHAQLRSHGGTVTHFELTSAKYTKKGAPLDVSTTPDPGGEHEFRQQLFTRFRGDGPEDPKSPWNVDYDSVDYTLTASDGKVCEFHYKDAKVDLTRTVRSTGRPYELEVRNIIKNVSDKPLRHEVSIDTIAWRTSHEIESKMFRISPYVTRVECMPATGKATRLLPTDFQPKNFTEDHFARSDVNPHGEWYQAAGAPAFASISNAYFSHAIVPMDGEPTPACLLQVEQRWDYTRYEKPTEDPIGGSMYRARLAYPALELAPNAAATYTALTYIGPKERDILAQAAGGTHRLGDLIDLGFFAPVAKVLVGFLLKVHSVIPNWGVAIILLTVTARTLLFPLSWPGVVNTIRMREIKPEMDALNEKYKDDAQGRGLAQMELWRKHKVNPFKGCVPQLVSMPVWFALYTTLQTAVELYNIPFLWFPDLSQSDPLFILPFVIGGTYFFQQKLMPPQGGDPAQQKLMMYMMPIMFTVFMLFLPSGLGVYMFTNSVLAITQQTLVERYTRKTLGGKGPGQIGVKVKDSSGGSGGKKNAKRDAAAGNPALLDEGKQDQ